MEGVGIVGNCQYNALIHRNGNVVWMCWPRFDASFIFGGVLDEEHGGVFAIEPLNQECGTQSYISNTNVLRTRFSTAGGTFEVTDFAPRFLQSDRYHKPTILIRVVEVVSGQPQIRVRCRPKTDYGKTDLRPVMGTDEIIYEGAEQLIRLYTDVPRSCIIEERPLLLTEKKYYFALTQGLPLVGALPLFCEDMLSRTIQYWRVWVKHCYVPEIYQRELIRSALVLKLHQFEETGAVIAATTTSIPEAPGSSRNWDYRYCWLRDSYFTVQALMRLSHFEELEGYERFLRNTLQFDQGRVFPMYTLMGEHKIPEEELTYLKGYRNHMPVRIGNAAALQVQNDAYGQALLALSPLFTDIRFVEGGEFRTFELIEWLVDGMERYLDQPDAGIWEFRGVERSYAFTSLMHWAGAKATAKAARRFGHKKLYEQCLSIAKRAKAHLDRECWNEQLGCFVIAPGSTEVDASLLIAINLGFLRNDQRRALRCIDALHQRLTMSNGLIQRYNLEDDGFGKTTSCFTVCSLWMAEALAHVGRVTDAVDLFERVLAYTNEVGLLSEDIDPATGTQWGNFPQTYSHVGVINAAFAIEAALHSHDVNLTVNAPLLERLNLSL